MSTTVEIQTLKEAHRKTWASGDYARSAELVTDVGERVAQCAGVTAGSEVLDVAAGTGNASIPAARARRSRDRHRPHTRAVRAEHVRRR